MKQLEDLFDSSFLEWLQQYNVDLIKIDEGHFALNNPKFCVKVYDKLGHGFGVSINVAKKFNKDLYDLDDYSLHWLFKYLGLEEKANFSNRQLSNYLKNLPKTIEDLKTAIKSLSSFNETAWVKSEDWIADKISK